VRVSKDSESFEPLGTRKVESKAGGFETASVVGKITHVARKFFSIEIGFLEGGGIDKDTSKSCSLAIIYVERINIIIMMHGEIKERKYLPGPLGEDLAGFPPNSMLPPIPKLPLVSPPRVSEAPFAD